MDRYNFKKIEKNIQRNRDYHKTQVPATARRLISAARKTRRVRKRMTVIIMTKMNGGKKAEKKRKRSSTSALTPMRRMLIHQKTPMPARSAQKDVALPLKMVIGLVDAEKGRR